MRELRLPLLLGSVVLLLIAGGCANRPPVLNCVADMSSVTEGNSVTIQSNATDPDRNDQLTFSWSAAQGRLSTQNGSASFDSSGLSAGNYTVRPRGTGQEAKPGNLRSEPDGGQEPNGPDGCLCAFRCECHRRSVDHGQGSGF